MLGRILCGSFFAALVLALLVLIVQASTGSVGDPGDRPGPVTVVVILILVMIVSFIFMCLLSTFISSRQGAADYGTATVIKGASYVLAGQRRLKQHAKATKKKLNRYNLSIPSGWTCIRIPEDRAQPIVSEVEKLVYSTWKYDHRRGKDAANLNHGSIQINSIYILHNSDLISGYNASKSNLELEAGSYSSGAIPRLESIQGHPAVMTADSSLDTALQQLDTSFTKTRVINEEYLFHGTKLDNVENIMRNGLTIDTATFGLYGKALYLAESSEKADQYTDSYRDRRKENLCMIIARTALGRTYIHDNYSNGQALSSLPCSKTNCLTPNCSRHQHRYHSAVAGMDKRFREFLIFEAKQCYPHIFVSYDRKDEHRVDIESGSGSHRVKCFIAGPKRDIKKNLRH